MAQLHPYLRFVNNTKEAMEFYKSVFGGELKIQTVGESPMAAQMPAETHKNVLHASLTNEHITIFGADGMKPEDRKEGNNISLCMVCTNKEEIERLYKGIAEGGKVTYPLKEEFFGTYGEVQDKFGVNWMFQFGMNS